MMNQTKSHTTQPSSTPAGAGGKNESLTNLEIAGIAFAIITIIVVICLVLKAGAGAAFESAIDVISSIVD